MCGPSASPTTSSPWAAPRCSPPASSTGSPTSAAGPSPSPPSSPARPSRTSRTRSWSSNREERAPPVARVQGGDPAKRPLFFLHGDLRDGGALRHQAGARARPGPPLLRHPPRRHRRDGRCPHTLEAIAADRLAALRAVQPEAPTCSAASAPGPSSPSRWPSSCGRRGRRSPRSPWSSRTSPAPRSGSPAP